MKCSSAPPLQAFLELNSEECAQSMVSYYASSTPVIRNHPIYMQYSTHKELKTDNSPNQVVRALTHKLVPPQMISVISHWWIPGVQISPFHLFVIVGLNFTIVFLNHVCVSDVWSLEFKRCLPHLALISFYHCPPIVHANTFLHFT